MLRIAVARLHGAPGVGEAAAPASFGACEQRRWATLAPTARRQFVASRALLRELLQTATGVAAAEWRLSAQAATAPVARAHPAVAAGFDPHVSLSHRLDWIAAAVAGAPVGVDVECDRPARSDPAERAALMLAPSELAAWQGLAQDAREADLLARWTAKEAWFKASPPATVPWDFRQVEARACEPAHANVRLWRSPPIHVALCCDDGAALADAVCEGLPAATAGSFWRVARATPAA